jgi:hypothetical protein
MTCSTHCITYLKSQWRKMKCSLCFSKRIETMMGTGTMMSSNQFLLLKTVITGRCWFQEMLFTDPNLDSRPISKVIPNNSLDGLLGSSVSAKFQSSWLNKGSNTKCRLLLTLRSKLSTVRAKAISRLTTWEPSLKVRTFFQLRRTSVCCSQDSTAMKTVWSTSKSSQQLCSLS